MNQLGIQRKELSDESGSESDSAPLQPAPRQNKKRSRNETSSDSERESNCDSESEAERRPKKSERPTVGGKEPRKVARRQVEYRVGKDSNFDGDRVRAITAFCGLPWTTNPEKSDSRKYCVEFECDEDEIADKAWYFGRKVENYVKKCREANRSLRAQWFKTFWKTSIVEQWVINKKNDSVCDIFSYNTRENRQEKQLATERNPFNKKQGSAKRSPTPEKKRSPTPERPASPAKTATHAQVPVQTIFKHALESMLMMNETNLKEIKSMQEQHAGDIHRLSTAHHAFIGQMMEVHSTQTGRLLEGVNELTSAVKVLSDSKLLQGPVPLLLDAPSDARSCPKTPTSPKTPVPDFLHSEPKTPTEVCKTHTETSIANVINLNIEPSVDPDFQFPEPDDNATQDLMP